MVQRSPSRDLADGAWAGAPPLAIPRLALDAGAARQATHPSGGGGSLSVPASLQRQGDGEALPTLPSRSIDDAEEDDDEEADVERLADQVLDRLAQRLAGERSLRGW